MIVKKFRFTSRLMEDKRGIVLGYNEHGRLDLFHIHDDVSDNQYEFFLDKIPRHINGLKAFEALSDTIKITEIRIDTSFETFWFNYYERNERKAGDKKKALRLWERMKEGERLEALDYMEVYKRYLKQHPHIQKRYAETFLSTKEWDNDK